MVLPWKKKIKQKEERIGELEERIEELEEEKESLENRFEAEKQRRSDLANKKQQAEEELNRLNDKLEAARDEDRETEKKQVSRETEPISFQKAYRIIQKIESVESSEKDMVTVYCPGKFEEMSDQQGLRNTISGERMELVEGRGSFVGFIDEDIFDVVLKTRPFFGSEWFISREFLTGRLTSFIEKEKTWALVSAGETEIYSEQEGDVEKIDTVKTRVEHEHSKGGFSQDRFERKRDEQVQEHLKQVKEVLGLHDNVYLLGERSLCTQLEGEYLGGFDSNRSPLESFYNFRLIN